MKHRTLILILIGLMTLCGCQKSQVTVTVSSDSLHVRKINDLGDDFILGMDVSSVLSLEDSGVVFYDHEGKEADLFEILAENGINSIRIRIWNDPYDSDGNGYGGGNCDVEKALVIAKRANRYGMKVILDFHYSDFWADPGKQMAPKAWKNLSIEEKADALYEYTRDSLKRFKQEKIAVSMVQIGNETNGALAGETVWMNIIYHLMTNASKAIREVYPKALIAVHFANPENKDTYLDYASKLAYYDLDYDVFATSYYPYWHGTLENLSDVLSTIAEKYDKKVMVMETSYAYTAEDSDFHGNTISDESLVTKNYPYTVQGQCNAILDIIDTIVHTKNGIGVCYWEGAWIAAGTDSYEENSRLWETYGSGWASSYAKEYDPKDAGKYYGGSAVDNQAFFDRNGHVLESLKLFALCRNGNLLPVQADAIEDVYVSVNLGDEYVLPDRINAIMNDNSHQLVDVEWNSDDTLKINTNEIGEYLVRGSCSSMEAVCHVSVINYNYLQNPSFEEDENGVQTPDHWLYHEYGNANETYVEEKVTDSLDGLKHYHFWADNKHEICFELEQDIDSLKSGNYRYQISIMGGDVSDGEIYAYVKVNGMIVAKEDLQITSYNNWDTADIVFESLETDTVTVGIHVECQGTNNGAWGKIDQAILNYMGE
ncbi:MAG: glycosyl hydrolase 53 family protein [Erysipelotrichaceae bacterium]|nr:glycosyl hydrolase 53 family protein [Erysipelotrichaceae bacterium]